MSCSVLDDGGHHGHKMKVLAQARQTSLVALLAAVPIAEQRMRSLDELAQRTRVALVCNCRTIASVLALTLLETH